jgi:hypothetical protein
VHSWETGLGEGEGEGDGGGAGGTVVVGGAGDGITVGLSPQLATAIAAPTDIIMIA